MVCRKWALVIYYRLHVRKNLSAIKDVSGNAGTINTFSRRNMKATEEIGFL